MTYTLINTWHEEILHYFFSRKEKHCEKSTCTIQQLIHFLSFFFLESWYFLFCCFYISSFKYEFFFTLFCFFLTLKIDRNWNFLLTLFAAMNWLSRACYMRRKKVNMPVFSTGSYNLNITWLEEKVKVWTISFLKLYMHIGWKITRALKPLYVNIN